MFEKITETRERNKTIRLRLDSFENRLCMLDFRYQKMQTTVDNRLKKYFDAEFV